jgi:hypothetical protein
MLLLLWPTSPSSVVDADAVQTTDERALVPVRDARRSASAIRPADLIASNRALDDIQQPRFLWPVSANSTWAVPGSVPDELLD